MKFIIFSVVLHIFIFIFGFSIDYNKKYEINNTGNSFSVAPSMAVSFNSVPFSEATQNEPITEEVAVEELPTPKPKVEEKKLEVIKEKPKKNIETPKQKKVLKKKNIEEKNIEEKKLNSPQIEAPSNNNNDLIELSHGVFAAKNQGIQGLTYSFISQPDPNYPLAAKRINYNKEILIKVRFLVGFKGEIEEVKFYTNKDNLGFQNEVEKALKKWKLSPVLLNEKPIKLYFYKEFKFNQK